MVPYLRRVVVDATAGFLDDVFQRQGLEFGPFLQIIEIHHVGIVVLAMVVLQGFLGTVRREGVNCVRQGRQGVFHDFLSSLLLGKKDCRNLIYRGSETVKSTVPSARVARSR